MAAESNTEIIRRGYAAFSGRDYEPILAFIHPEFEATTPPGLAAEPDTYRGHEGVRRYFESFYEVMDEIRFEPNEIREVGDLVVVDLTLSARGRSTGLEVEQRIAQVWELEDGRAIGVEVFATLDEALAAAEAR